MDYEVSFDLINRTISAKGDKDFIDSCIIQFVSLLDRFTPQVQAKAQEQVNHLSGGTVAEQTAGPQESNQRYGNIPSVYGCTLEEAKKIVSIDDQLNVTVIAPASLFPASNKKGGTEKLALLYCGAKKGIAQPGNKKDLRQICDHFQVLDPGHFSYTLNGEKICYFTIEPGTNGKIEINAVGEEEVKQVVKGILDTINGDNL